MRDPRVGLGSVLVTFAVVASCTGSGEGSPTTSGEGGPTTSERREPGPIVMEDFESGTLNDWRAATGGSGGWFVYADGQTAPDPAQSDPNVPFDLPDPPQGELAAVTDMNGPGTRILYRDLTLDGRFTVHLTVFYASSAPFRSPETLAYDGSEPNQQFRIDLVDPSAPIDSLAEGDVLVNVFHTSPGDPNRLEPTEVSVDVSRWAGETVRLRLAAADNSGPLRVGVDNIGFQPVGADPNGGVEFPVTEEASSRARSRPAPNERSRGGGGAVGPRRGARPDRRVLRRRARGPQR